MIHEIPYDGELSELFQRGELPLIKLTELVNDAPNGRARALIVANDKEHTLFNTIINSRLYVPAKMTLTLLSPKNKEDFIGQCCATQRGYDCIFLSMEHLSPDVVLTDSEARLLKSKVYCF